MIDFACKKLDLNEVMRCGLGITKTEQEILNFLIKTEWFTAIDLSKNMKISLATAQRSLKNLHEKNLILRRQQNLELGGYLFFYKSQEKEFIKSELKDILSNWTRNVESSLDKW
ncbi:MAG: helix-turn-helix domain-containing protein [Candidatus Woesearchaeota archaeon]